MSRLIFAIQLLLIPALQATAAPDSPRDGTWSLITDGSVSFYTKGDPARAKPLLRAFSQLRDVLASASAFPLIAPAPLKVIAFQSEEEFNLYRLNAGSCAFFQQTRHSDYVVLQDLTPGHREVAMHEFTHFLLSHSGVTLPLWLNEGLADFYSTFELSGNRVTLGAPVEGRLSILHEHTALPLEKLFQVSPGSSYYSDPELMLLFYSESWAFTHMLIASPAYSPRFPDFVKALKEAHSSAEALRLAFGKTPAQVQQDLRAYLDVQHLPRLEGTLRAVHADAPASLQAVSGVEMAATLGDLLPGNNTSEEELGYQALEHGQAQEARAHFRLAVERHSSDPNVLFYLAHLDHEAGVPSSQVLPLLDRALALQPDLPDARLELALLAANDGDFARALAALQKLSAPRPENAYVAIYTEAYCFARLNHMQEARAAADRARLIARNDRDRAQVSQLLEFIADRSK
jgi:tetratricopeptide (TPR) repeat protein